MMMGPLLSFNLYSVMQGRPKVAFISPATFLPAGTFGSDQLHA